jgi:hypothetical protein
MFENSLRLDAADVVVYGTFELRRDLVSRRVEANHEQPHSSVLNRAGLSIRLLTMEPQAAAAPGPDAPLIGWRSALVAQVGGEAGSTGGCDTNR